MGLESYLFYLEFDHAVPEEEADVVLLKSGFRKVGREDYAGCRSRFYEYGSHRGITEAHLLLLSERNGVDRLSIRFSIMSPPSVIDQTFELISAIQARIPSKILDTEIEGDLYRKLRRAGGTDEHFEGLSKEEEELLRQQCYISPDAEVFKKNFLGIGKRRIVLENPAPGFVRGGEETFDYIRRNGLAGDVFDWIEKEI